MKKITIIITLILASFSAKSYSQETITDGKKKSVINSIFGENTNGNFILAVGKNTISNSQKEIYDNLDMRKSRFYEIGYALNTRLSEKSNLLHLNYGLSLVYNNIQIKNGYAFEQDITEVVAMYNADITKARFRNVYLQVPVHLEFDFTSEEKLKSNKIFKQGFKIGVGGFLGFNMNTKQFLDYNNGKEETYSNYKMNNFTYGISSYIGYNFVSLYVKYDVQGMFKHNSTKEKPNPHNVSFGLRFDI